ncbi:hypothetical protein GUJ93_ZPchr0001g29382 [Zizania palustris]|uniref:Uncharacterized protein n=1 Tax=Zizania palustris TaxID=103762 RepID=A0A8J5S1V9_ZIZPA|nr:hypothetical protein GUJ93_ZPchr0001g29382 [Zizania palustris]
MGKEKLKRSGPCSAIEERIVTWSLLLEVGSSCSTSHWNQHQSASHCTSRQYNIWPSYHCHCSRIHTDLFGDQRSSSRDPGHLKQRSCLAPAVLRAASPENVIATVDSIFPRQPEKTRHDHLWNWDVPGALAPVQAVTQAQKRGAIVEPATTPPHVDLPSA